MPRDGSPETPRERALAAQGRDRPLPYSYRDDPAVPGFPDDKPLIVFDGVCVLCSGFAQFVIRRDTESIFRFAPAQSPLGEALFRHYGLDPVDFETNLLIHGGYAWGRTEAFVEIMRLVGSPWSLVRVLMLLPRPVRDWLYERVARNRYAVFGKLDTWQVPQGLDKERLIS